MLRNHFKSYFYKRISKFWRYVDKFGFLKYTSGDRGNKENYVTVARNQLLKEHQWTGQ